MVLKYLINYDFKYIQDFVNKLFFPLQNGDAKVLKYLT